ncbi:TetR family transcriptional regulator [Streptomyces sp. BRB081]|nr:TetR family transcriptional regulator [Streptomyces sp. BRB081]
MDGGRIVLDDGCLHPVLTPAPLLRQAELVLLVVRMTEEAHSLAHPLLQTLRAGGGNQVGVLRQAAGVVCGGRVSAGLDRERIADAAVALADRDGLEVFGVRRLAQELGVDPMSIHHHVKGKRRCSTRCPRRCSPRWRPSRTATAPPVGRRWPAGRRTSTGPWPTGTRGSSRCW